MSRTASAWLPPSFRSSVTRNRSTAIAKEALKTGGSVYALVLEKGWLTQEQLDDMLRPENKVMIQRLK